MMLFNNSIHIRTQLPVTVDSASSGIHLEITKKIVVNKKNTSITISVHQNITPSYLSRHHFRKTQDISSKQAQN